MRTAGLDLQDWLPIAVLAVLVAVLSAYNPRFQSSSNLLEITANTKTLFLMALGLPLVIMMVSIDLSVQSIASMASCVLELYMPQIGAAAIPLALLGDAAAGAFNSDLDPAEDPDLHRDARGQRHRALRRVLGLRYPLVSISGETRDAHLLWVTGSVIGIPTEIWVGPVALIALSLLLQLTPLAGSCAVSVCKSA